MGKYFYLQFKRIARTFAVILAVSASLVLGVSVIVSAFSDIAMNGEEHKRFKVALCGDTESSYIELGLQALQTIDDTRFSLDVIMLSEEEAASALAVGDISAYVVLPDSFIENALSGVITPVTFVTSPGQSGVVTMFKNEITHLITDLVVYSEKGTYAIYDALRDNGAADTAYKYMNIISIEYAELVFGRGDVYSYRSLGISDGLDMSEYYTCALAVLLIMLMGIPFASIHIRGDRSLDRILLSRGYCERSVLLCEYAVHAICMLILGCMSMMLMTAVFSMNRDASALDPTQFFSVEFALRMIPAVLMISAFDILIFESQDSIVSGVLSHFFAALCLGYASGCMYPIYALPKSIQSIAPWLPSGLARSYAGGTFTYEAKLSSLALILSYTVVFLIAAYAVRVYKTRKCER